MRARRFIPLIIILILIIAFAIFLIARGRQGEAAAAYGEPYALCPGPDQFGYQCEAAGGISYVDAAQDTGLQADEGDVLVNLPFSFNFYGTDYTQIRIGSNGTLHFDTAFAADFIINCVDEGPIEYLGEMLAPYWDDLDNRTEGAIETAVIGQEPNRVFVIEWDGVMRYFGEPGDTVTFEVQLFETTNQVVYLYQDLTTFEYPNGANALVGMQSVQLDTTLTYSCRDDVLADKSGVTFVYPETPNPDLEGAESGIRPDFIGPPETMRPVTPKGDVATLIDELSQSGLEVLPDLQVRWLNEAPGREATWQLLNMSGDEAEELVYLWRGPAAYPELAQLAVLSYGVGSEPVVLLDQWLTTRTSQYPHPALEAAGDVTGDGLADLVLMDQDELTLLVVTNHGGVWQMVASPEACKGRLALLDSNDDRQLEIVREDCPSGPRVSFVWQDGVLVAQE